MTGTNCVASFLLEHKVVNAPFLFFLRFKRTMYETMPTTFITGYTGRLGLEYGEPIREWVSVFAKTL